MGESFVKRATASPDTAATLPASMAQLSIKYNDGFRMRCKSLNDGKLKELRSPNATRASLVAMLTSSVSIATGVENIMQHAAARSQELAIKKLKNLWEDC